MKTEDMKYKIWYDPTIEWWDEWAVCINFSNDISVTYSVIRKHIYPYLEIGITNFIPINCNDVIAKKVQILVDEWKNRSL